MTRQHVRVLLVVLFALLACLLGSASTGTAHAAQTAGTAQAASTTANNGTTQLVNPLQGRTTSGKTKQYARVGATVDCTHLSAKALESEKRLHICDAKGKSPADSYGKRVGNCGYDEIWTWD